MQIKKYQNFYIFTFVFFIFGFLSFISTRPAQAQVIAIGVEERNWVIDAETALRGITFSNLGERVRLALGPDTVNAGTQVELTTYASQYYIEGPEVHRVTPIYRVVIRDEADPHPASGHPLPEGEGRVREFPVEIRYHGEDLGKKSVWVWGEDDVWREIPSQNIAERNAIHAKIPDGTTYVAVFARNQILEVGVASWYNYKNCHCAASPDYPKGTKLKVTNIKTGDAVEVVVNDFGPDRSQHPDRVIDLDRAAFEHLANPRVGLIRVKVEKI